jgi:creatinine amidohydrolase
MKMKFNEQSDYKLEEKIRREKIALLPIGAVESHGDHLPLGTDSILAERLAAKVVERVGGMILPTIHYAQVWSLGRRLGSIGISNDLLRETIKEIGLEVKRNGFKIFVIINAHLGNLSAIKEAVRAIYDDEMKIYYFTYPGADRAIGEVMESGKLYGEFFHAEEIETSYMLYLAEEYVDMSKAIAGSPEVPAEISYTPIRWDEFSETSVMGDATKATREKGRYVIDSVVEYIAEILKRHL